MLSLLEDLHEAGRTIVLITHEHDIAERAERTIQIRDGQLWLRRRRTGERDHPWVGR